MVGIFCTDAVTLVYLQKESSTLSEVSRLNPVGLSGYSVTIKLCDSYCLSIGLDELRRSAAIKLRNDSRWRVARHDQYQYVGYDVTKDWLDYCLRFYLSGPLTCYGSPSDVKWMRIHSTFDDEKAWLYTSSQRH
ncbi:uncharacterized protein UHOD_11785 [Ustilago sp. UG-2017b]|nr:uncharacterized protein UHOD_11785 [Ustilago sp. UG-2017b]